MFLEFFVKKERLLTLLEGIRSPLGGHIIGRSEAKIPTEGNAISGQVVN